jgi:hypothetical protein
MHRGCGRSEVAAGGAGQTATVIGSRGVVWGRESRLDSASASGADVWDSGPLGGTSGDDSPGPLHVSGALARRLVSW